MNYEQDWAKFVGIVSTLTETYGKPALSRNAMTLWFNALRDMPIEAVSAAADWYVSGARGGDSGRYMPKPADLRNAFYGSDDDRAGKAWVVMLRARESVSRGYAVRFPSPEYHQALEACGGWRHFTEMSLVNAERIFCKAFKTALHEKCTWQSVRDVFMPELEGWASPKGLVTVGPDGGISVQERLAPAAADPERERQNREQVLGLIRQFRKDLGIRKGA